MPLLLKSKMVKLFAPFQIEVNNRWQFIKERFKKKDALGLILLFASSWLANTLIELVTGRRPLPDEIQAVIDATKEMMGKEGSASEKIALGAGRVFGELLNEVTFSQYVAMLLPEDQRQALFGENDPSRFGVGSIGIDAMLDPIFDFASGNKVDPTDALLKVVPPYGGTQAIRTKGALEDLGLLPQIGVSRDEGGTVQKNSFPASYSAGGGLRNTVGLDPWNIAEDVIFGNFATKEGREYLENDYRPLSDKQTKAVQTAYDKYGTPPDKYVDYIRQAGKIESKKAADITAEGSGAQGQAAAGDVYRDRYEDPDTGEWRYLDEQASVKDQKIKLIDSYDMTPDEQYGIYYNDIFTDKERAAADGITVSGGELLNAYKDIRSFESEKDADGETISGSLGVQVKGYIDGLGLSDVQTRELYGFFDVPKSVLNGDITRESIDAKNARESKLIALGIKEGAEVTAELPEGTADYSGIPDAPMIPGAEQITVDSSQMTEKQMEKLSGMGLNPRDYYYIDERESAIDTVDKIGWYESLGLTGRRSRTLLKTGTFRPSKRRTWRWPGTWGSTKTPLCRFTQTPGQHGGKQERLKHPALLYLEDMALTDKQKEFMYYALKFSQKQYKTGSEESEKTSAGGSGGGRSSGGGSKKISAKKYSIPSQISIPSREVVQSRVSSERPAYFDLLEIHGQIKDNALKAALAADIEAVDKNPMYTAAMKSAAKEEIRKRYARA